MGVFGKCLVDFRDIGDTCRTDESLDVLRAWIQMSEQEMNVAAILWIDAHHFGENQILDGRAGQLEETQAREVDGGQAFYDFVEVHDPAFQN